MADRESLVAEIRETLVNPDEAEDTVQQLLDMAKDKGFSSEEDQLAFVALTIETVRLRSEGESGDT